jgi:hypothetical protein
VPLVLLILLMVVVMWWWKSGSGDGGGSWLSLNVESNKTKINMSCARIAGSKFVSRYDQRNYPTDMYDPSRVRPECLSDLDISFDNIFIRPVCM